MSVKPLTGGQALVRKLLDEGVVHVFGIPGVQLDWAVEAIREAGSKLSFVMPRHEQATTYMADGYARSTGRVGVSMVVPGPGVLNALAALSTAYACNSRVLFLAGQIPSAGIGRGLGFLHEIPRQTEILGSLTKWNAIARRPEEIAGLVGEAFAQLRSGRPRPVALEIPPDVLQAVGGEHGDFSRRDTAMPIDAGAVADAAREITRSRRPLLVLGGGAAASADPSAIAAFAERLQAPVVMTESARGVMPDDHPLALPPLALRALLPHADLVLVAGSRFLDATGQPHPTADGAKLIYVNAEPSDAAGPRPPGLLLEGAVDQAFVALGHAVARHDGWGGQAAHVAQRVRLWCEAQFQRIDPQWSYLKAIRAALPRDGVFVSELTQVGYMANVAFPVHAPRSFITPGYQGTLGYGFNTALGAAVGNPERFVVSVTGDGGFGWGLQELATAAKYKLNVAIVVFADGQYGNVKRIQKRTFGETFSTDLANPDFAKLAEAFGVRTTLAGSPGELERALVEARHAGGPTLIHAPVGEMPSPWHLIHRFVAAPAPPPELDLFVDA